MRRRLRRCPSRSGRGRALGSGIRHGRYGRGGGDRVALVLSAHSSFSSVPRRLRQESAVQVSAVSFSHSTSGHCKQDLCICPSSFTPDKKNAPGPTGRETPTVHSRTPSR
ncbi:hypothetical protein CU044_1160 [Streptomyces sp. L-9-10]|nr:hypothetical protein CU044_1160 [Streptomyces sp. L-9-10]